MKLNLQIIPRDKEGWPLYLTIGNLPTGICGSSNSLPIVTITLLHMVPAKKDNKTQEWYHHYIQDVSRRVPQKFQPASVNGREIKCVDGRSRICHPIAYAWLPNHP